MQKGVSHRNVACVFFCLERKYHFKNRDLSLKAKGLLSLMLSLSEDWNDNIK